MEEVVEIKSPVSLSGEVTVGGAKNAVLPMLIASLLTPDTCVFHNVPAIRDVFLTIDLLKQFGASIDYSQGTFKVQTPVLLAQDASYSLVKAFRASFWILGPLLARGRAARVALPGGDIIGARPVDMHLDALTQMGATIRVKGGVVYATAEAGLRPAHIELRFPSVGATHQILLAASLTPGTTRIVGAAREPEIVAVAKLLIDMGAEIEGAGTSEICIQGKEQLGSTEQTLIGDRIEAATFCLAAVATRSKIAVNGFNPEHFGAFVDVLCDMGVQVNKRPQGVDIDARGELKPVAVTTAPFPGLATDIQALLMAALVTIPGMSRIEETIFEGRFGHVAELCRLGARVEVSERVAEVKGGLPLTGAPVEALDIRAAAGLVIAALAADGVTQIHEPFHLSRGYDSMIEKFRALGADMKLRVSDPEDFIGAGC
ncbi:MAG: UDP-N-acetylglucosamine 1-carboxyvinyltransferase [Bdellovibrionales bacterium]|nr:UDP-N-acetylglucosamine 1-carboxyvinyltransferase [Bdellovibrionales bacterium]